MTDAVGAVLLPARAGALVAMTTAMYALFELECAVTPKARYPVVLSTWIERWGRGALGLLGVDVVASGPFLDEGRRYPGADAGGRGRVFVMNHRSGLDIPLILAYLEARPMSRADIGGWPVIGVLARRINALFVDRSDVRSGAAALAAMVRALRAGQGVVLFPEGTTFEGDVVRPFRPGAFRAVHKTGAELVPIGVAYEDPRAAYLDEPFATHLARVTGIPRTRVAVAVGEPLTDESEERLRARAHDAVQALVHRARAMLNTK